MLKIIVINPFGEYKKLECKVIPQIGSHIDIFYTPCPTVKTVLMYPSNETIKKFRLAGDFDAIITVE